MDQERPASDARKGLLTSTCGAAQLRSIHIRQCQKDRPEGHLPPEPSSKAACKGKHIAQKGLGCMY